MRMSPEGGMDFAEAAARVSQDSGRSLFDLLRLKWHEVPSGLTGRVESESLLRLGDHELRSFWHGVHRESTIGPAWAVRGWYHELYRDIFRNRRVLEIGSGMGIDAIHFIANGAKWHFADIARSNLALIKRLVDAFGYACEGLTYIEDLTSLDGLPRDFDFIFCQGSLIHVPFEFARHESMKLIGHLRPGGRWIELCYPRERWQADGSLPFSEWGKRTDGEKTPWAEWYDLDRLQERLAPIALSPLFAFDFDRQTYNWFDLKVDHVPDAESIRRLLAARPPRPPAARRFAVRPARRFPRQETNAILHNGATIEFRRNEPTVTTGPAAWSNACQFTIQADDFDENDRPYSDDSMRPAIAVEVVVQAGTIGVGVLAEDMQHYVGREQELRARTDPYRVVLPCFPKRPPFELMFRNAQGVDKPSRFSIPAITLTSVSASSLGDSLEEEMDRAPVIPLTALVARYSHQIEADDGQSVAPQLDRAIPIFIEIIDAAGVGTALGYTSPSDAIPVDLAKKYVDRKMEVDDAPILAYLYRNHAPRRHLEFGTWEGFGAALCARNSDAEIWTLNLPDGETGADGRPMYAHTVKAEERGPAAHDPATAAPQTIRTDSGSHIGRKYREAGLQHRVHQILVDSTQWDTAGFAEGFFDSVLIDGGHGAAVVASDTDKALPLLRSGGLMMWHDFCPADSTMKDFSACRGVVSAIHANWERWSSRFTRLFWIRPSFLLVGLKR